MSTRPVRKSLLSRILTSLSLPLPPAHESRTLEVFLPPWTIDCPTFFFCCSLTLGVKVVAPANRRKSIACRFREFFRCSPKSVQYVQLLTVRPHLYMNAAAPLYHPKLEHFADQTHPHPTRRPANGQMWWNMAPSKSRHPAHSPKHYASSSACWLPTLLLA